MAKVFKAGKSNALRLPRSLDVKAKTYEVTPMLDGFMIIDLAAKARRLQGLRKLRAMPPIHREWPRP